MLAVWRLFILFFTTMYIGSGIPRHTRRVVKMGPSCGTYSFGVICFFRQFCGHRHRVPNVWLVGWKLRMAFYVLCTGYTNWLNNIDEIINITFFLFLGFVALIWCTVWLTCIAESPIEDKHISKEELKYIIDSIGPVDDENGKYILFNHNNNIQIFFYTPIIRRYISCVCM